MGGNGRGDRFLRRANGRPPEDHVGQRARHVIPRRKGHRGVQVAHRHLRKFHDGGKHREDGQRGNNGSTTHPGALQHLPEQQRLLSDRIRTPTRNERIGIQRDRVRDERNASRVLGELNDLDVGRAQINPDAKRGSAKETHRIGSSTDLVYTSLDLDEYGFDDR